MTRFLLLMAANTKSEGLGYTRSPRPEWIKSPPISPICSCVIATFICTYKFEILDSICLHLRTRSTTPPIVRGRGDIREIVMRGLSSSAAVNIIKIKIPIRILALRRPHRPSRKSKRRNVPCESCYLDYSIRNRVMKGRREMGVRCGESSCGTQSRYVYSLSST